MVNKGHEGEVMGLIYSRINNPDMEILEERLKLWDEGEAAAAFSSGMSAIATSLVTYLSPGDVCYIVTLCMGAHINLFITSLRILVWR